MISDDLKQPAASSRGGETTAEHPKHMIGAHNETAGGRQAGRREKPEEEEELQGCVELKIPTGK